MTSRTIVNQENTHANRARDTARYSSAHRTRRNGARADDKADVEKELKKFHGTWTFASVATGGKEQPAALFKGMTVTFAGTSMPSRRATR